jgi:hypothetical protein
MPTVLKMGAGAGLVPRNWRQPLVPGYLSGQLRHRKFQMNNPAQSYSSARRQLVCCYLSSVNFENSLL